MKIRSEDLISNGYVLTDTLNHEELPTFLRKYLNKRTKISILYYITNFTLLIIISALFIFDIKTKNFDIIDWFLNLFVGFSIAILLIPLHEFLHVLAYKSQGAKNTSFDANLKKFYFMALADNFVASKEEFKVIALAPFIVITTILILFLLTTPWKLTILSIMLCHSAMSSGDFALISYFEYHKDKEIVTYDDVAKKISYFYGRK